MLLFDKATLARMVQFISSFNNMNHHTERKRQNGTPQEPTCTLCCEGDETGWHLATECPVIDPDIQIDPDNWTVSQLATLVGSPVIKDLLKTRGGAG